MQIILFTITTNFNEIKIGKKSHRVVEKLLKLSAKKENKN